MADEETQEAPVGHITFTQDGNGWKVDSNVQHWQWHILQIAAEIKRAL